MSIVPCEHICMQSVTEFRIKISISGPGLCILHDLIFQEEMIMAKAARAKQLSFEMPNKVGSMHEISAALSQAKINITSLFGIETGDIAIFMLITGDNAAAKKLLRKMGIEARTTDVITVDLPNKPGALTTISGIIAQAGIDILTLYGTAGSARSAMLVMKTSDDKKALKLLNK